MHSNKKFWRTPLIWGVIAFALISVLVAGSWFLVDKNEASQLPNKIEPSELPDKNEALEFNSTGYKLSREGQSPYIDDVAVPLEGTTWEIDSNNVLITTSDGVAIYQPVTSARYINRMINSYRVTKDQRYLDRAIATANHVVDGSEKDSKGAIWFPYEFTHDVKTLRMGTPWYSGMAQGMMVSTFVNLYEATGEEHWRELAADTVKPYDEPKNDSGPWFHNVSMKEGQKFVFYEEYPAIEDSQNAHVVNGHIYALYGLYDYHRVTGDEHAQWLFDVGASSIRDSFDAYRNPGEPSWYAITDFGRSTWGNPASYHGGVIAQLSKLGEITGDTTFTDQAALLRADHS